IRPGLILSHFALAATGLVLWIIYVFTDSDALAWIAFVILLVVAVLGWTKFASWWRRRQRGALAQAVDPGTPARPKFPVAVGGGHQTWPASSWNLTSRARCFLSSTSARTAIRSTGSSHSFRARNHPRRAAYGTAAFAGEVDGRTKRPASPSVRFCDPWSARSP